MSEDKCIPQILNFIEKNHITFGETSFQTENGFIIICSRDDLISTGFDKSTGNVRIFSGGWGFHFFNYPNNWQAAASCALENSRKCSSIKPRYLSMERVVVREEIPARILWTDMREAIKWIADIKNYLSKTQDINFNIQYSQNMIIKNYSNSEGSSCFRNYFTSTFLVSVDKNGYSCQDRLSSINQPLCIDDIWKKINSSLEIIDSLKTANDIVPGNTVVLLDQELSGLFFHEAVGHLLEADSESQRSSLSLHMGEELAQQSVSVYDDGTIPGKRASSMIDDEGVKRQRTCMIDSGRIARCLHTRETASEEGIMPYGNGRAANPRYQPISRMTNTIVAPGNFSLQKVISGIDDGLYCKGAFGGTSTSNMFSLYPRQAFKIRNGTICEQVKHISLHQNPVLSLKNIEAVCDDPLWNDTITCGKGGVMKLPVGTFAPHILMKNVSVRQVV